MKEYPLKYEIAQLSLSDFMRKPVLHFFSFADQEPVWLWTGWGFTLSGPDGHQNHRCWDVCLSSHRLHPDRFHGRRFDARYRLARA